MNPVSSGIEAYTPSCPKTMALSVARQSLELYGPLWSYKANLEIIPLC